jgi:glycerophosphoryl diester phosphodiesterase
MKRMKMKGIIIFLMGAIIGLLVAFLYVKLMPEFKTRISRENEYREMHQKIFDLSTLENLIDEEDTWYTKHHFISHSGGAINGKYYTNSLEAWDDSYKKGNRVFDADISVTTDGKFVLRHEWNDNLELGSNNIHDSAMQIDRNGQIHYTTQEDQVLSLDQFMKAQIHYIYSPLTCDDMLSYMDDHKDLYISCDTKGNMLDIYSYLVKRATALRIKEVLDRIIVNVYNEREYFDLKKANVYDFKNFTVRQHFGRAHNYFQLAKFCLENNIHVVNLSKCYVEDEGVQLLLSKGIHVYVAVEDYISDMQTHYKLGITGAVSNWLHESDWDYIENLNNFGET